MRVGGIAAALEGLAPALARTGLEVHVVTCGASGGEADEQEAENLFVHRVNVDTQTNDFLHWVHELNARMDARADALVQGWLAEPNAKDNPIVLHAHDWLGLFAGKELKYRYHLPLLSTIHATEFGRNNGIHTDMQRYINHCEWELQWESWRVIVCSGFMRGEVMHALHTPYDKIDIIYNGVSPANFEFPFSTEEQAEFKAKYAAPGEKLIYFIGRMVREKGAQVLVESMPKVRAQVPNAKLVIAGGGYRSHLEARARELGMTEQILFTGRVSDEVRDRLYRVADVAVYPSIYEPFGIVALEAMAAYVPVVVSEAGGLAEVVKHDVTGTTTLVDNPDSLAWGITRVLQNPAQARAMAANAFERVETVFNWDIIATQTADTYNRVWSEYTKSEWANGSAVYAAPVPALEAPAIKEPRRVSAKKPAPPLPPEDDLPLIAEALADAGIVPETAQKPKRAGRKKGGD
ncbi:MAG: glycosyltransferase family 4 protein [Armatimonadetes bacterium]|nr:glycosyltransferase family 4 protein [Armatimonadota bacterium]